MWDISRIHAAIQLIVHMCSHAIPLSGIHASIRFMGLWRRASTRSLDWSIFANLISRTSTAAASARRSANVYRLKGRTDHRAIAWDQNIIWLGEEPYNGCIEVFARTCCAGTTDFALDDHNFEEQATLKAPLDCRLTPDVPSLPWAGVTMRIPSSRCRRKQRERGLDQPGQ